MARCLINYEQGKMYRFVAYGKLYVTRILIKIPASVTNLVFKSETGVCLKLLSIDKISLQYH
jgi:hypothetical protein